MTGHLAFAIAASAIGSAFQHGYHTGVLNSPKKNIDVFIAKVLLKRAGNGTVDHVETVPADLVEKVDLIFSAVAALFCVGGLIGALCSGFVANKFGRRNGLLYNNVLVLVAALLMGLSKVVMSFEMLMAGRFVIGINAG